MARAVALTVMLVLLPMLGAAPAGTAAAGAALAGSGAAGAVPPAPTRIEYEGTLELEAHFRHPGDVHSYHSLQIYSSDGAGRARLDWTTWEEGDTQRDVESYLVAGGRVFYRPTGNSAWSEYQGARARQGRLQAGAGIPEALAILLGAGHPGSGERWTRSGGRIESYVRRWAHPRLGDVRDEVSYTYSGPDPAPDAMTITLYMRDANWTLTARRTSWSAAPLGAAVFAVPEPVVAASPSGEDDALGLVPPLVPVAPGVFAIELTDIDSRTLVAEFGQYLAVMETAVGSANGERIVDAIHRQWPGKPIRYALFSHYHPHYTGGLRALIAEGAIVITTPGNEALVRRIATYPFNLQPDRLARSRRGGVSVITFKNRYELSEGANRLVAINYGERSQHTDEFVLFWFPSQKLLFESEQGWSGAGETLRAGRRAKGLLAWIGEQGLDVGTIIQGWPMRGTPATMTRSRLEELVVTSK